MIEINFKHATTHYALYNLVTPSGEIIHIGIIPFNQLTAVADMPLTIREEYDKAYLSVLMVDEDRMKLANHGLQTDVPELRERLLKIIESWGKKTVQHAIRCVETGESWESAAECAKAHDLTYGALLRHLSGDKSFNSVKGKTYRKVEES